MKRNLIIGVAALCGLGLIACGSSADSEFEDPNAGNPPSNGVPEGATVGAGEIGPRGTGSACVSEVASAQLAPTNLVFIYDKSGSMGDAATGFDPAAKWTPVSTGMKEFFADDYSKTLRASLQFFPLNDVTVESACNYGYAAPSVPLTSAADGTIAAAIDATKPSGGTPTLPALEGAIAYAKQVAVDRPGDKTAVVLVSDGEPGFYDATKQAFVPGCVNNDVAHSAAAAKAAYESAQPIPTYVIGVGPKLEALNAIASAGGTKNAVMVDTSNPAATKLAIVGALAAIRKTEVSCDFTLPPPPAGKELDPYAVNVVLKQANGSENVVGYSKDCSQPGGWHYDDVTNPKRILLCPTACNDARASASGQVSIAFGCKTRVAVN